MLTVEGGGAFWVWERMAITALVVKDLPCAGKTDTTLVAHQTALSCPCHSMGQKPNGVQQGLILKLLHQ